MKTKRFLPALVDRKSWWTYAILNWIDTIAVKRHFCDVHIEGREKLPRGSFILISNHSSRWDGPVVQQLLGRPANWMVTPNELRGLQGLLLRAFGAFPADPRSNLIEFMRLQARKAEPIVIFPEGDIYRDGSTHSFKQGAARSALMCAAAGLNVPVVPIAVQYGGANPGVVRISVGDPVDVSDRCVAFQENSTQAIRNLTQQLHREVCHLRAALGSKRDRETVFDGKPVRFWMPRSTDGIDQAAMGRS
ncbi:MAG TPA: lysophospholipid acyltransferase family protein [Planktothrix sp.]|jgi:1-acyl-sn-glycerol-3-phosphate acyltransferase